MRTLGKIVTALVVSAVALGASAAAFAQDKTGGGPGVRPHRMGMRGRMMMRYQFGGKLKLTDEQKAQIKKIFEKAREDAHKVLTDEQRKMLDEAKAKGEAFRKEHGLNLSEEQKAAAKKVFTAAREKAQAAKTGEEKQKIWQAAREEFRKLLNADQIKKLDEMKARRGEMMKRWGERHGRKGPPPKGAAAEKPAPPAKK